MLVRNTVVEEMDPRERERQEEKARERKALLDRAYDRVISSQLSKLASKKTVTGECDVMWCCIVVLHTDYIII